MKNKVLSFTLILLFILCLSLPTFASTGNYAFAIGSYRTAPIGSPTTDDPYPNPIDTREAVQYAANKYTAMGYNGNYRLDPSPATIRSCLNFNPTIVMFDAHGGADGIEFKNSYLTSNDNYNGPLRNINIDECNFSQTQLVIYMGCSTAKVGVSNITKETSVLLPSRACAIGWKGEIFTNASTKWSKEFHNALANNYTVSNAINYANDSIYVDSTIKELMKYGGDPVLSSNSLSTMSSPTLDNKRHYITNTVYFNEDNLSNINSLIEEKFNETNLSNYKTVVTKDCLVTDNENDPDITIIDYILQIDGFTTEYGYTVHIEDNIVKYIVDNREGTLPMARSSYTLSNNFSELVDNYKNISARAALVEYPTSHNAEQDYILYYDTKTGKRYIIINTTNVTPSGSKMILSDYYEI